MRLSLRTLFSAMLVALLLPVSAVAQQGRLAGLDEFMEKALHEFGVPGAALSVVMGGEVVHAKGYGVRRVGGEPVDERTVFAIGSASKPFTTATLAMLIDEGKLTWDDKVQERLPGFALYDPYVTKELTIRDLVSHRSGLSRGDIVWYGSDRTREEIVHQARYLPPTWSFRSTFEYNNTMFITAGEVVEEVSGQSWDDFISRRLFNPLGMTHSNTSVTPLARMNNVATPHAKVDGHAQPIQWRNIDNAGPAGSINSNVTEMAEWVRMQLAEGTYAGRELISAENIKEMHTPHTIIRQEGFWGMLTPVAHFFDYGLGWFLQEHRGRKAIHHGGNIDGMSAMVLFMPDEDAGFVLLSNLNQASGFIAAVLHNLMDRFTGEVETDWIARYLSVEQTIASQAAEREEKIQRGRITGTSPSLSLDAYAGRYRHAMYGEAVVTHSGGTLTARYGPAFQGELTHWHLDTFRATWQDPTQGPMFWRFSVDEAGRVTEVEVALEGDVVFARADEDENER